MGANCRSQIAGTSIGRCQSCGKSTHNTVRRYLRAEITEPAYAVRRSRSAIHKYAFQLSAMLKTEAARSRKQRRTLKQIHEDLRELGFEGSYDRVAAFARVWREGQTERVNPSSKRTLHGRWRAYSYDELSSRDQFNWDFIWIKNADQYVEFSKISSQELLENMSSDLEDILIDIRSLSEALAK